MIGNSEDTPVERVKIFINAVLTPASYNGHEASVLRRVKIISASISPLPTVVSRITITPDLCQGLGNLQGGATSLIFDCCTTFPLALIGKGDFWWEMVGVSRTLNVTYLDAVKAGEEVEITGEVMKAGKKLTHTRGLMRKIEGGKAGRIVATCEHGKVNLDRATLPPEIEKDKIAKVKL